MKRAPKFLASLDRDVVALLSNPDFQNNVVGKNAAMLSRLTCSPSMDPVWKQVRRWKARDDELPVGLLVQSMGLRRLWEQTIKIPTKQLEATFDTIAREARQLSKLLNENQQLLSRLYDFETIPRLADPLQELADGLDNGKYLLTRGRPTKLSDKNAERTFCVRRLADFFEDRIDERPCAAIGRIVTEVLDLGATSPLDADHVRKLLRR